MRYNLESVDPNYIDNIRHQILLDYIKRNPILSFEDGIYVANDQYEESSKFKKIMNLAEAFEFFKMHVRSIKS